MSDTNDTPADPPEWRSTLQAAAREFFSETGRGLLLSGVPGALRNAGIEISDILGGQKLAPFLSAFGPPDLHLIRNDENPAQLAILPSEVEISSPLSQYFPKTRTEEPEASIPRFHPAVWRCFVTHLEPEHQRWIDITGTPFFYDRGIGEEAGRGVEVDREFVRTDSLFRSNEAVAANIQNWAAKHGVDMNKLTIAEPREPIHTKPRETALISFLSVLRSDELARISIPADIIARLVGVKRG